MGQSCRLMMFLYNRNLPKSITKILFDQPQIGIPRIIDTVNFAGYKDLASGFADLKIKIVVFIQNKRLIKQTVSL